MSKGKETDLFPPRRQRHQETGTRFLFTPPA